MRALIVMLAVALPYGAASANDQAARDNKPTQSPQAQFESLDRDRDGSLSKMEVKANSAIASAFASFDVNTDGYLSKPEYFAYVERTTTPQAPQQP